MCYHICIRLTAPCLPSNPISCGCGAHTHKDKRRNCIVLRSPSKPAGSWWCAGTSAFAQCALQQLLRRNRKLFFPTRRGPYRATRLQARKMTTSITIGPVSVTIFTICMIAVGIAFFCCFCCFVSRTYTEARQGKAVPYGGREFDPKAEGTIWPKNRMNRPDRGIPAAV